MRAPRPLVLALGGLVLSGCSSPTPAPPASSTLPPGVVARVGSYDVRASWVARVAASQHVPLERARDEVVRDTLFAAGARAANLEASPQVAAATRARLARSLLARVAAEATSRPPTDAEVEETSRRHYYQLDRPAGSRVIHAVVMLPKKPDDAARARARKVASELARSVTGAATPSEFRAKAEATPRGDLEIRVEELDPVAEDGRIVTPANEGSLLPEFAAAASKLAKPGDQSGVVETSYGYHVMMLLERTPAMTLPLEQRRSMLREEILALRARSATEQLSRDLRAARNPEIERSADELLRLVPVAPP